MRVGDYAAAREAFHMAAELGAGTQPGLATLDLAEGRINAAAAGIRRALEEDPWDRLHRSRLLPAHAAVAIASGDLSSAAEAATEIEEIADAFQSSALIASAASVRGAVQLAQGDHASAIATLRRALRLWQQVEAPYEAAQSRMTLAEAYIAAGDRETAAVELRAARSAFERLGAAPAIERAARLLDGLAGTPGAVATTRHVRTFMFTDICSSTPLVEAIGDDAWEDLLRWHDGMLRDCFVAFRGEEIKHGGDGFFVAFPDAASAIDCAIRIQRRLVEHRRDHGFSPQVRIGLHAAEATSRGKDYSGKGVNVAARIGALAGASEILISRETAPNGDWKLSQSREVTLKGIAGPIQVLSIDWR